MKVKIMSGRRFGGLTMATVLTVLQFGARANTIENQNTSDASNTSSLTGTTNWSPTTLVSPTNTLATTYDYESATTIRTPANQLAYTIFADSIVLSNNAALGFKGSNVITIPNLILNGGTLQNSGTSGSPDMGRLAGAVNLMANSNLKANGAGTFLNIMSTITNASGVLANLTESTAGTVILSAQNTFAGNIILNNVAGSVVLQLGVNNALPDTCQINLNNGANASPILDLNGFSTTISNLDFTSGSAAFCGIVTNSAAGTTATLTLGFGNGSESLANGGVIGDKPSTAGTIALTKIGTGTLTLDVTNNYHGDTTVSAGTLKMGASALMPNGAGYGNLIVDGTFDIAGREETVNGLAGNGTIDTSGGVAGQGYTLTVGGNNASDSFSGVFQNTLSTACVALAKIGSGTETLSGASTYNGNTTISAGTLALSGSGSISGSTNIIMAGGATFDVSGLSSTFGLASDQVLSNNTSTAIISGNANTGSGTLSLTYSSGTPSLIVSNGTFTLASDTIVSVNNTGAMLSSGSYVLISNATTGNAGAVAGTAPLSVTVNGGGIAMGTTASLQINNGELNLVIASSAPPTITGIGISGATLTLTATNGAANGNFVLLGSTNLLLPLPQWTPLLTNSFDSNGNLNLSTNVINPSIPVEFYILQTP